MKRRILNPSQQVLIIYHKDRGPVKEKAVFLEYRHIEVKGKRREIPFFRCNGEELSGLVCFWILPDDLKNEDEITKLQKDLIGMQMTALEISNRTGIPMEQKINDPEINKDTEKRTKLYDVFVHKYGFDPVDTSWLEEYAADSVRQQNWFKFERQNESLFSNNWKELTEIYNHQFNDKIDIPQAQLFSKMRARLIKGAELVRMSGNSNPKDWVANARAYERFHYNIEQRMHAWSESWKNKFPVVQVKRPFRFFAGPYFNECVEKIPKLFVNAKCSEIKAGTKLRIISYDPTTGLIRFDFMPEIRRVLKPHEPKFVQLWNKTEADYDFFIQPDTVKKHVKLINPEKWSELDNY